MTNLEKALSICKGKFQRDLVLGRETLGSASLRGKAANYRSHYEESGRHLIARLTAAGVRFEVKLGPRGGWWNAKLVVADDVSSQTSGGVS